MKIAIQGIKGSFHEQAAHKLFPNSDFEIVECETFRDVFNCVNLGNADYGVVGIENSLNGPINPVYRLLANEKLKICGEARLHIELCLVGHSQTTVQDLKSLPIEVYSQNVALSQCEQWFAKNLPNAKLTEINDTAEAIKMVTREGNDLKLAVGSHAAAEIYGGQIVAVPVNDDLDNYTRFVCITKNSDVAKEADKTAIVLTEKSDQAGNLYAALGVFANLDINLTSLHSHPLPGKKRIYNFYIDFDEPVSSDKGQKALQELSQLNWKVEVLGSYKSDKH